MTVTLEATFRELNVQLKRAQDCLLALHLTVAEDKPERGEAAMVEGMDDSITAGMGLLEECIASARVARKSVEQGRLDRARRSLQQCQEGYHAAERKFADELIAYDRLRGLAQMSAKRGAEWVSWAGSVKYGLEQCRGPISEAGRALASCWQELAERSGTPSIVINSQNLGQKVNVSGAAREDTVPSEAM
jgi:hypothetical protein